MEADPLRIKEDLAGLMRELVDDLAQRLRDQGHNNTGELIRSLKYEISLSAAAITADLFMAEYGSAVDTGVKASRVPYNRKAGNRSSGRTSKYIEGLIDFFQDKGFSEKNAINASFATANVHAKEGIPTKASSRFSSDGSRLGFLTDTIVAFEIQAEQILTEALGRKVEVAFDLMLDGVQAKIKR